MRFLVLVVLAMAACGGDDAPEIDAAMIDAALTGPDAAPACLDAPGQAPCNATEFCYAVSAGLVGAGGPSADAGPVTPGCNGLPADCATTPTCACVVPHIDACAGGVSCLDDNGPHVTCVLP